MPQRLGACAYVMKRNFAMLLLVVPTTHVLL